MGVTGDFGKHRLSALPAPLRPTALNLHFNIIPGDLCACGHLKLEHGSPFLNGCVRKFSPDIEQAN